MLARDGEELETHYRHILAELPKQGGMLGETFKKARQEIQNPATLKRLIVDLIDFVACFRPGARHERQDTWSDGNPDGRWQSFSYEELTKMDKLNLDVFWLRDESLEDSENLPEPEVLAAEIVEGLQAALEAFEAIQAELEA